MTAAKNDVTGDLIKSKTNSEKYRDNYDKIFNNGGKTGGKAVEENENVGKDEKSLGF